MIAMRTVQLTVKLVSQHKDSLYYSKSGEEIVEEGTA
jgi:hypothetical protein